MLSEAGLCLKKSKCHFLAPQVTYCGFAVSRESVAPISDKVEAIVNAPAPRDVSQVKSFLGMINYYHRHLPHLANCLEPLHELLRNNRTWNWGKPQQTAFDAAKTLLSSANLLVHYNPNRELILSCDASPYGIGAVLSHIMDDNTERPVAFASRTMSPAERNYAQIEKEGLGVYAVKKFHQYLYGCKFTILTDHKPLLGLLGESRAIPSMTAARIQRWALLLARYSYTLKYRPGNANVDADCMSRLPINNNSESSSITNTIHMMSLNHAPVTAEDVRTHTRTDPIMSKVFEDG